MRGIIGATALALAAGAATAQEGPESVVADVLFGFDRETLDAEAIETLSDLTDAFLEGGADIAAIVGHADTVGDPDANRAIGLRRALTVRQDLLARGVPSEAIAVTTTGEADLAVETGDEVRARANRRVVVEIAGFGTNPAPDPLTPYSAALPPEAPTD